MAVGSEFTEDHSMGEKLGNRMKLNMKNERIRTARKGVMFSFIVFFLATTVVSLIFLQRSLITRHREQLFTEMRVRALNNMYDSITRDLGKILEIIVQRAMVACFNNVSASGVPLSEANETLKELILFGTLVGVDEPLMENNTFPYWVDKIEAASELKGFFADVSLRDLRIKPYDSFNLVVEVELNLNLTDERRVASLNRSILVEKKVSIEGMEDPLYPLNTRGLMFNSIVKSPHIANYTQLLLVGNGGNSYVYGETTNNTGNFDNKILIVHNVSAVSGLSDAKGVISELENTSAIPIPYIINSSALSLIPNEINILLDGNEGKVWYIDNLKEHVENSYYQPSQNGPSYLDRLEGKHEIQDKYSTQSENVIGLESFVNKMNIPPEVSVEGDKANIDYIYFSDSFVGGDGVKGLPETFIIDDEHKPIYNITEDLTISS